jgi:hypothetical protein
MITTTTTTPVEAASALASLMPAYDAGIGRKKAAKQALDQAAVKAAEAALARIWNRVRELMQVISEKQIIDGCCRVLVLAASRGGTPQDLQDIAEALRVSTGDGITIPMHHFETLSRGRGWARLGRGKDAVWGDRVEGGYRLRQEGRWIIAGHDGFDRRGEHVWDVRRVAGVWIAN